MQNTEITSIGNIYPKGLSNLTLNSPSGSKIFIAIAGNIGTGKTSLTQRLSERHGWEAHFESVEDNPYLSDFYKDMTRWSFPIQIFFLNSRIRAHRLITSKSNSAIQDRSIYEDAHIFARNLYETGYMEKRDYFTYLNLYSEVCHQLEPPDLLIYLRKDLDRLISNIRKRGRDYEANISEEYLRSLNRYYDEWIERYDTGKLLVLNTNEIDFVQNPSEFDLISSRIFEALDQKELFTSQCQNLPS